MASRSAILSVKVLVDSAKAATGVDTAASKFDKLRGTVSKLTPAALAVGGALVVAGKQVVDSASRQQQAIGAVDSVFGKNAGTIKKWAAGAADSVGLSKSEYMEFASVVGAQFKNLGVDAGKSTKNTNKLIGLGADLAATFGGSTSDAVNALSAALRGEADPAERYGLSLNQTRINAYLAAKGQDKLKGSALTAAKAQAVMDLATKQAGGAIGQFGRESDTLAGQQQRMAARFEDTKAALGQGLLPVVTAFTAKLSGLAGWMGQNTGLVTKLAGVLGGLAGAVLALNVGLKAYTAVQALVSGATKAWTAVNWLLNTSLLANPITWLVAGIAALVVAVVLAWKKFAGFRNFVKGVGRAIAAAWTASWKAVKAAAAAVASWLTARWKSFQLFFKALVVVVRTVWAKAWQAARKAVASVVGWVTTRWRQFQLFFKALVVVVRTVWAKAWQAVRSVVASVVGAITSRVSAFRARVASVASAVRGFFQRAWAGIRTIVATVVGAITSRVSAFRARVAAIVGAIRTVWTNIFNRINAVTGGVLGRMLNPITAVRTAFDAVVSAVRSVIGWVSRIRWPKPPAWLSKVGGAIGGLFSRSAPAPAAAAVSGRAMLPARSARSLSAPVAPQVATAAPASAGVPKLARAPRGGVGGGDTYMITVTGGLDSADSIARRIEGLLAARTRRTTGVVAGA